MDLFCYFDFPYLALEGLFWESSRKKTQPTDKGKPYRQIKSQWINKLRSQKKEIQKTDSQMYNKTNLYLHLKSNFEPLFGI